MIFEQNQEKIIEQTLNAFAAIARGNFVCAVIAHLERKKHLQSRPSRETQFELKEELHGSSYSFEEGELAADSHQQKKKTMKSIIFKESMLMQDQIEEGQAEALEISEVLYGDKVLFVRGGTTNLSCRTALCAGSRLRALQLGSLRARQINIQKYLFEVVDPQRREKKQLEFGDLFALKSLWNGKYLRINMGVLAQRCFGCQTTFSKELDEYCTFRIGKTLTKQTASASNSVFTHSQLRLVLAANPFYKLMFRNDDKAASNEQPGCQLVGSCNSEDLQLVKQQVILNRQTIITSSDFFYLSRSGDGQLLASSPCKKEVISSREKTYTALLEGDVKCSFCVDDVALCFGRGSPEISYHEDKTIQGNLLPNGIWSVAKSSFMEPVSVCQDEQVLLVNCLTQQYLHFDTSLRTYVLTNDRTQASYFTAELDEDTRVCSLRLVETVYIESMKLREESLRSPIHRSEIGEVSKLLTIRRIPDDKLLFWREFGDVLEDLVETYHRIAGWALTRDDKNDQHYLYLTATNDEYLLRMQLNNYQSCLKMVSGYLKGKRPPYITLVEAQRFLLETKILQVLIYFCRLTANKMEPNLKNQIKLPANNAFIVAKKNLQPVLMLTVDCLFEMIRDSRDCSDALIQYASFFNQMLVSYPQQAGRLLQQAIRNLSILHTSYTEGQQLFQWVKLVDYPSISNLPTQIKYLQILAEVMVDPNDNGIANYQNRCHQQLFSQRVKFRTRNLMLSFELDNGQPFIVAESESILRSPQLRDVVSSKEGRCCIALEKLLTNSNSPLAAQLLEYTVTVVKLLRNMCKDRNKKLAMFIQSLGLNRQYVGTVVRRPITPTMKLVFLDLYFEMYVNRDPFVPFHRLQCKCLFLEQLSRIDVNSKLCSIFRQYSEAVDVQRATEDFDEFIVPFLQSLLSCVTSVVARPHIDELYLLVMALLRFFFNMSNLGFMRVEFLRSSVEQLIDAVAGIFAHTNNGFFDEFGEAVILETTKLLKQQMSIVRELLVIQTVAVFHRRHSNNPEHLTNEKMLQECRKLVSCTLDIKSLSGRGDTIRSKRSLPYERMDSQKMRRTEVTVFPAAEEDAMESPLDNAYVRLESKSSEFLLGLLFNSRLPPQSPALASVIELLQRMRGINHEFGLLFRQVEIITNQQDAAIFFELTAVLNIYKLELQCSKLIGEFAEFCGQKARRQIILEINSLLKKLSKKLELYAKQGTTHLRKAQRILRNLGVQKTLRMLVQKAHGSKQFREVVSSIHQFLVGFIRDNCDNKQLVARDFCMFARNDQSPWLAELLRQLFEFVQNKQVTFRELLEVGSNFLTNELIFEVVSSILQQDDPLLRVICCEFILQNPANQRYFMLPIEASHKWFYRVLSKILRVSPEVRTRVSRVLLRKDLEQSMMEASYTDRIIYYELFFSLYFYAADTEFQRANLLSRFALQELKVAGRCLDGLVSDAYLLQLTTSSAKDDEYLQMERRSAMFTTARQSLQLIKSGLNASLLHDKKSRKNVEIVQLPLTEQTKFWQFLSENDRNQCSLFQLLEEAFENHLGLATVELKQRLQMVRDWLAQLSEGIPEYLTQMDHADYILTLMDCEEAAPATFDRQRLAQYFTSINQALAKAGIPLQELLEMFALRYNFMELMAEGSSNLSQQQLPPKEFVRRFERLRKRLLVYESIPAHDFRMFFSLYSKHRCMTHIFMQKLVELQVYRKAGALNGMFLEMRGHFAEAQPEETAMHLVREIYRSCSQETQQRRQMEYGPSKLLMEATAGRFLNDLVGCLNEQCASFREDAILEQVERVVGMGYESTSSAQLFERFVQVLKVRGYDQWLARLFETAVRKCKLSVSTSSTKSLHQQTIVSGNEAPTISTLPILKMLANADQVLDERVKQDLVQLCMQASTEILRGTCANLNCDQLDVGRLVKLESLLEDFNNLPPNFSEKWLETLQPDILKILLTIVSASDSDFVRLGNVTLKILHLVSKQTSMLTSFFNNKTLLRLIPRVFSLVPVDLYTSQECVLPVNQLFGGLLELLINYYSGEAVCYEALAGVDFRQLIAILQRNYREHYEFRRAEIDSQEYCHHDLCDSRICQKHKLKPADDNILRLLCKVVVFVEVCWNHPSNDQLRMAVSAATYQLLQQFVRSNDQRSTNSLSAMRTQQCLGQKDSQQNWQKLMDFYSSISGKIEIVEGDTKKQLYFKLPFIRAYRTPTIKAMVVGMLLDVEADQLPTQLHKVSQIMHEQLLAEKFYEGVLPRWFLWQREHIQFGLAVAAFILNVFVCYVLTMDSNNSVYEGVCRMLVGLLAIPQAVYCLISTNTSRRILKASPKLCFMRKITLVLDFRQIGLILQLLSLYKLECYPVSCLLLALSIRSIKRMMNGLKDIIRMVFNACINVLVLLTAVVLMYSSQATQVSPLANLGRAIMQATKVVIEQQPLQPTSLLYQLCHPFSVVFFIRAILLLTSAMYIVAMIAQVASTKQRLRRYESTCMICLRKAVDAQDMKSHIANKHNIWNYLDFFVYLRQATTLSSSERVISRWIEEGNLIFLAIR